MNALADKMDVSTKTIQRYLVNLTEIVDTLSEDLELIIHPSKGIELVGDFNKLALLIRRLNQLSINEEKDRLLFIISALLNAEEPITLQAFADELYIGRSTVEKAVSDARNFLKDFGVNIQGSNKGLTIETNETLKRKILSELVRQYWHGIVVNVMEDTESSPLNILLNNQLIPMMDGAIIEKVQTIVHTFINNHELSLTEYQYQSLIIHVAIAVDRINKEHYVQAAIFEDDLNKLTMQLVHLLETDFQIVIPSGERQYLNIYIEGMTNQNYFKGKQDSVETLEYGVAIWDILEENLAYLSPDEALLKHLTVHLNTSIKRLKQGIRIRNPYKEQVQREYSTSFNLAVELSLVLSEQFQVLFNIDEMTYIAIHLQSFFERQQQTKLDVVLVCASGFGTVKLLEQRIKQRFGDVLNITDIIGLAKLQELDYRDKLIISTIPIDSDLDNIISVSPLLSNTDIENISHHIQKRFSSKETAFHSLQDSELIFYSEGQKENWMTVIEFIVRQLIFKGYAEIGLLESAYSRERLSSTALKNFSMPHGDTKFINKSVISVYVNPHGIQWGKQRVNVVFFFAMNPKEGIDISGVYKDFNDLISNTEWMEGLIRSSSRNELINYLTNERDREHE